MFPTHEVHIWCARPGDLNDEPTRDAAMKLLSPDEAERRQRYRFEKDRRRYLAARVLLRRVLSSYDPRPPSTWEFVCGEHGRPEIAGDCGGLRFNVSKTENLVVCAVAAADIGVDVENMHRSAPLNVADQFFAEKEVAELRSLPDEQQPRRFYEYWTLKESYLKARGAGLTLPLDEFAFRLDAHVAPRIEIAPQLNDQADDWQFELFQPTDRHMLAVCVRGPQQLREHIHLRWRSLSADDPESSRPTV